MAPTRIDTIAASATPIGKSAIGLIRISGASAFDILKKVFKPKGKRTFPSPFCVFPGTLFDPVRGSVIDQVVVTTYASPASYTGEDLAEIGVHGNPIVLSSVLSTLFAAGAVPAEAGEFTRRAFLNGKMDLLDVEAVSQIIHASTQTQAFIALNQLEGVPSRRLSHLRETLIDHLTHVEAGINFPEDAIEDLDESRMRHDVTTGIRELADFLTAARQGNLISSGLALALVGKPNTGKSSLLNTILGRERAIVTEIPGTTRDTLEESWNIAGFPVKLIDTAGIRKPGDTIEAIGIERTRKAVESAFLMVGVFDASAPVDPEDREVLDLMRAFPKPKLAVLNKCDLPGRIPETTFEGIPLISLSAKTGQGIPEFITRVEHLIRSEGLPALSDLVLLGAQQTDALAKAIGSLKNVERGIGTMYHDLLSVDLSDAIRSLGMVTGETVDVDTLDRIFERFCIGK